MKDLSVLNNEIINLVHEFFPQYAFRTSDFLRTLQDVDTIIARCNLSSYETMQNKPNPKFLLEFNMNTPNRSENGACEPLVIELEHEDLERSKLPSIRQIIRDPVCMNIEDEQKKRQLELTVADIMTTLPNMWFNSVAIDFVINYFKELCDHPEDWYIVSAEDTPERRDRLKELQRTKGCNKRALLPLYREHHWTIACIDHELRIIYYLNSDVVDRNTPIEQTRPFQQAFPGYKLIIIPCIKQCDNSSCGAYVCCWAYIFLKLKFKSLEDLLEISCPDILRFRTFLRRQLLLTYLVCPRAGESAF